MKDWRIFLQGRVHRIAVSASEIPDDERYDSVVYDHVLEGIARDAEEMRLAAARLAAGGRLIVVAAAYPWLYSKRDRRRGVFRRYSRERLAHSMPEDLVLRHMAYRLMSVVGVWEKR